MKALEFVAEVDAQRHLQLELSAETLPGPVRVLVLLPEVRETESDADAGWMQAIAREWQEELADSREDIYTLEDGHPLPQAADAKLRSALTL